MSSCKTLQTLQVVFFLVFGMAFCLLLVGKLRNMKKRFLDGMTAKILLCLCISWLFLWKTAKGGRRVKGCDEEVQHERTF